LANRRQLGLGFAVSHTIHAAAITGFAWIDPEGFHAATSPGNFVTGGLAYVFIVLMAVTVVRRRGSLAGSQALAAAAPHRTLFSMDQLPDHLWQAHPDVERLRVASGRAFGSTGLTPLAARAPGRAVCRSLKLLRQGGEQSPSLPQPLKADRPGDG